MLLRDPKNETDDRSDIRLFQWKSITAFITPENVCILRKSEDEALEYLLLEILEQNGRTYLHIAYEWAGKQGLISLESGNMLSIDDLFSLKYTSDDIIQRSEWSAKDAYVVTRSDGTKTGYLTTHGVSTTWKEIKNVKGIATEPVPWIIQWGPPNKAIIIPINS